MCRRAYALLCAAVLSCLATDVAADDEAAARQPVVLVLSGGGARGAAHVGVLRMLEELCVPVDAVVGTSMGAVVGGLYAAGLDAAAIEQVVRDIDWRDAFVDTPSRSDLTYRRKRDDDNFLVPFEFGVRDGALRLPEGLIQAQKLVLYLRENSLPVAGVAEFDALPTPFRAVAADLVTGDAVVIDSGELATAMQASMSAPGVFAPVDRDGRTLVDGGLAMNLPVEAAQAAFGPATVIAVDVGFPLLPAEALDSAVAVSEQMLSILIERETRRQRALLGDDDVFIQPDLGLLGSTAFGRALEAIDIGYEGASRQREALAALSLPPEACAAHARARRNRTPQDELVPDFVTVRTDADIAARVIRTRMATQPGQPLSIERLRGDLARIYGLGLFERVGFRWMEQDGERGIVIDAQEKSWGPAYLRFGLGLEEDFEGSGRFNVAARYLRTAINSRGAEWRTDVSLGTRLTVVSEFYQPLDFDLRYFVAPIADFDQRNLTLFENGERIARYRLSTGEVGLFFGREISNWGEVRAGVYRGSGNARVKVGDPTLENFEFNAGGYRLRFGFDTLDDTVFPASGSRLEIGMDLARAGLGSEQNYETLRASWAGYRTWGRHTVSLGLDLATSEDADLVIQEYNQLGGFLNLSGLDRGALLGPHALVGRAIYQRRFGDTGGGLVEWPVYLGASVETGNVWQTRDAFSGDDLIVNGSLFARLDTFLGPIYLATGFGENGETSFYLFVGAALTNRSLR